MLFGYATCQHCTWGGQPLTCTNWPIFYYLEKKQNHFKIVTRNHRFVVLPSSVKLVEGWLMVGQWLVDGRLVDGWLVDGKSMVS